MPTTIDQAKCDGCGSCVEVCPTESIKVEGEKAKVGDDCADCGACVDECPNQAITSE